MNTRTTKHHVLVGHPSRQHSHHLAEGLSRAGLLDRFYCGQLARSTLLRVPKSLRWLIPKAAWRNSIAGLHGAVRTFPVVPVLQRLARVAGPGASLWAEWAGFGIFDWWFARQVRRRQPSIVMGYESCCLSAFRAAKEIGAKCVLDAAACHYHLQDSILPIAKAELDTKSGQRIRRRKRAEIELADLILCPSQLSADSYRDSGIDRSKIEVNPLGVDLDVYRPALLAERAGAMRFLFVGNSGYVKGYDILLAALSRINGAAALEVVGAVHTDRAPRSASLEIVPHGLLPTQAIVPILARCDCLVLPSRLESFGMVVLEALAAGLPVIASTHAGASCVIRPGINGWIVEPDPVQLTERLQWCVDNVEAVRKMRVACIETAREYRWQDYQERTVALLERMAGDRQIA